MCVCVLVCVCVRVYVCVYIVCLCGGRGFRKGLIKQFEDKEQLLFMKYVLFH